MSFKVSCENVADSMRKHAETLTAHLRLAQDEVKARSVMLAHTEEQAAFQRQQHLLERKDLEDEYAKQAWQADKNELKIQEMMAESSNTAAETVSRIARSQEKEAKAAARAEQLEVILRELRATLAHSQEESTESSKQVLSLEKAHSDFQEKLAENRKITADLETQIYDLEDQLKLCSTELHESEARHLQQQQQQISQERSRQQTQEMRMEQMQRQCQMSQVTNGPKLVGDARCFQGVGWLGHIGSYWIIYSKATSNDLTVNEYWALDRVRQTSKIIIDYPDGFNLRWIGLGD